jgi:tRNA pseudouridine55 synthase
LTKQGFHAIIISLVVHILVLGGIHWWTSDGDFVSSGLSEVAPIEVKLVAVEVPQETPLDADFSDVKNLTANSESAKSSEAQSFSERASDKMAQEVYNDLKNLEQQVLNELAQEKAGKDQNNDKVVLSEEQKDLSDYEWYNETSYDGRVTNSYVLTNRSTVHFPTPGYTCRQSGQVTLDVVVANSGEVLSTEVNLQLTTTSDPCLIEQSRKYAELSRFNSALAADKKQRGTITYLFIAQ